MKPSAVWVVLTAWILLVIAISTTPANSLIRGRGRSEDLPDGGNIRTHLNISEQIDRSVRNGRKSDNRTLDDVGSSSELVVTEWRKVSDPPNEIGCSGPEGEDTGKMYRLVAVNRATDPPTETVKDATCFFEDAPPAEDAAPTQPTTEEIREIAVEHIDPPQVRTDPPPEHGGVTGLENWFWYEGPQEATAESAVRGYTVTATMRPTRFVWEPCAEFDATSDNASGEALGCPIQLTSSEPGRQPDNDTDTSAAAARWTYETEGRYVIRHEVLWEGRWTFTGHSTTTSGTLSPVRTSGEISYQVNEIRSRLTGR